ncbi:MAG TPA: Na+/H+ antiporter NhaA [Acidimicrobiia bacterium]|nr:Na+/H+ antiporter NhaA [Acidimicrobiia bacterium]
MPRPGEARRTRRISRAAQAFVHTEASAGIVLFGAAVVALVWSNSPWDATYTRLWDAELGIELADLHLRQDLRHWVNDGLMALFFLVVGLEVKREVVDGELSNRRAAALPLLAALGGMVVPAVVYTALNVGRAGADGWGVPVATDIAFALAVLAVVDRRANPALKAFLLTLAVADDIGAIIVIAVFYAGSLSASWLFAAAGIAAATWFTLRMGLRSVGVYVILGLALWLAVFESGLHATIAGVTLGLITPARVVARRKNRGRGSRRPLLERVEGSLHPWTSFVVVPIFALANSGIALGSLEINSEGAAVVAGTVAGLLVGKFAGILGVSWLAVRVGVGRLPAGVTWTEMAGVAACAGIGFTVSLFIAGLAFADAALIDAAKVGILGGSFLAGAAGALILRRAGRTRDRMGRGHPSESAGDRRPTDEGGSDGRHESRMKR